MKEVSFAAHPALITRVDSDSVRSPTWHLRRTVRAVSAGARNRATPNRPAEDAPAEQRQLSARTALQRACRDIGLDPTGAELLGRSAVSVYRLSSAPVVARVRRNRAHERTERRRLGVAGRLAAGGAPTIRPYDGTDLVRVDDFLITFWEAAARPQYRWRIDQLGRALRELHAIEPPESLPRWPFFDTLRTRLAGITWLRPDDLSWLTHHIDEVEVGYAEAAVDLDHGVIHGDAHIGNLLRDQHDRPVLCDLDTVARAPVLIDLIPTAVAAIRFGKRERQQAMVNSYGYDITDHPAWPILRETRELTAVTNGLEKGAARPRYAGEATYRLRLMQQRRLDAPWYEYA